MNTTPVLFLSLHLSSHSPYLGLAEMGETYPLRENVKRMVRSRPAEHDAEPGGRKGCQRREGAESCSREAAEGQAGEGGGQQGPTGCCLGCDVGLLAGSSGRFPR